MTGIKYDYSFIAGFYRSDQGLVMNEYKFKFDLTVEANSPEEQNTAFNRMDFFIQEVVENSIFVSKDEEDVIEAFDMIGMDLLILDSTLASDQIVLLTITDKLNAITDDAITIFESSICSRKGGYVEYIYWTKTPGIKEDSLISKDKKHWWNNPTIKYMDSENDEADIKKELTWKAVNLEWPVTDIKEDKESNNTDNIVTLK